MAYSKLLKNFPNPGILVWIGLRSARNGPVVSVEQVSASPEKGLHGDRYAGKSGNRQVTLIQQEHLAVLESFSGRSIDPGLLRRNLLISGINLLALKNSRFRVGEVILESTGYCHPCSKMERVLGAGGLNAMRGHGGLTARIVEGGIMRLGESVVPLTEC